MNYKNIKKSKKGQVQFLLENTFRVGFLIVALLVFFLMMQIYEISRHRIILFKGDIYQ